MIPPSSAAYRGYALAMMTAIYMLNLVDRGLMGLLLQPIKEDLHLSDTQLGFVTGIAFGLFYAVLGIPIARWADRGNRVSIASLAIGLWGLTVMACLFVSSYAQLVFARIAAAVGEAGCKPPTYSLVGDYFPEPAARARAMSIYWLGGPLSTILSFMVGGWLNGLYGWRMTFFLMGIPGLLLALVFKLTVVEPRAAAAHDDGSPAMRSPRARDVLRILWTQRSCRHLGFALILFFAISYGMVPWYAPFMMRSHGMVNPELGLWLGAIFTAGGMLGGLSGGYVVSRWLTGRERDQARLSAATFVLSVPLFILFLMVQGKYAALVAMVPLTIIFMFFMGPTYALMQRLVPDNMRATSVAIVMLLANLIGMGLGPQIVGILSDRLAPMAGADSLRYAMAALSLTGLWAAVHFLLAGRTVADDLVRSRA